MFKREWDSDEVVGVFVLIFAVLTMCFCVGGSVYAIAQENEAKLRGKA